MHHNGHDARGPVCGQHCLQPSKEMFSDYFTTGRAIFKEARFNLRSWASNSQVLTELAKYENIQDSDPVTKLLGLRWKQGQIPFHSRTKATYPQKVYL